MLTFFIKEAALLNNRKCIGILGGGQLARMSAYQAYKLGFDIAILEKEKNSPAGQLTKNEFVGWVNDNELLKRFSERSDVITLENEFVDSERLKFIEHLGKKVYPSSKTISLIQDKLIQKQTLAKKNIPVPKFIEITNELDYNNIKKILGNKFILKSRKMGYDGYGNFLVKKADDFSKGINALSSRHSKLMAEEFVDFNIELAIMVVRTKKEIAAYPVVQTIQKNYICHTVIAPAQISNKLMNEVKEIAVESVKAVNGFGIFGIELFLLNDEKILVNEMAPRPHNSGHYSIEACIASQFENHIRAALNLPLGSVEMVKPYAVMINLLGKKNDKGIVDNYEEALKDKNIHLHIYGKERARIGRKMGHITIIGDDLKSILKKAKRIEKIISV